MMINGGLSNILAVISSFTAMLLLGILAPKMGGSLGNVLKFLIAGIFFSVFLHSIIELASIFGMIGEVNLMYIMGGFLTIGSIFFMIAALIGLKALK